MKYIIAVLMLITSIACFGSVEKCEIEGRLAGVTVAKKNKDVPREEVLKTLKEYLISEYASTADVTRFVEFVGKVYDVESNILPADADHKYYMLCRERK